MLFRSAELALILLKKDGLYDLETFNFFDQNAIYIKRSELELSLENEIKKLMNESSLINEYKEKIKNNIKPKLISWDKRIKKEIDLIKKSV